MERDSGCSLIHSTPVRYRHRLVLSYHRTTLLSKIVCLLHPTLVAYRNTEKSPESPGDSVQE